MHRQQQRPGSSCDIKFVRRQADNFGFAVFLLRRITLGRDRALVLHRRFGFASVSDRDNGRSFAPSQRSQDKPERGVRAGRDCRPRAHRISDSEWAYRVCAVLSAGKQEFHGTCIGTASAAGQIHGGPTSSAGSSLKLGVQYWTSRGFAVVDVNYGGSTGYGREYRERLNGQWGIVDVEDCIHAARYLGDRGDVDPKRMAIRGGSAGGYTTLSALVFHHVFASGASHYGVADLAALASDTHKFESRYLDRLIGPYPEAAEVYRERSPIHFADRLSCPVILFQGTEDKVVPPNQAETFVAALRSKQLPYAYVLFA
jgi:dienelactone hydrolase